MNIKTALISVLAAMAMMAPATAQETGEPGFVITLKNGSTVRGRTLSRDEASGTLRLTMTPKSYAVVAVDDVGSIRASTSDTDSILIRVRGGSEIRCKEFGITGETVTIKLGTMSRIEVPWDQIESISFGPV
ncbi:MAG TPA: hypothetical protein VJH03_03260 [Blastocatellia bacterium]|nr:hypothetical protein [Blastocatellia bacterium]